MTDHSQLDNEPDDAYELYVAYATLPPDRRDLATVAVATGHDPKNIANYSSEYRWHQRAARRDASDKIQVAQAQRRLKHLLLDQASRLDSTATSDELIVFAEWLTGELALGGVEELITK